ncbi:MAG: protease complex subunit PrcB family protein [Lachnospiraceae bacterium]
MKRFLIAMVIFLASHLISCGIKMEIPKEKDLEFTVVSEECLEEELRNMIYEKQEEGFTITYVDDGYMYLCIGYGKQKSGGYSIAVKELFLSTNAIYVDTNLIGPKNGEEKLEGNSYPYIVIKIKELELPVVFE